MGKYVEDGTFSCWREITPLINKAFNRVGDDALCESTYRKRYSAYSMFYKEIVLNRIDSDLTAANETLMEQFRKLEQNKILFRDERRAWNRQNYITARVNEFYNKLEKKLTEPSNIQVVDYFGNDNEDAYFTSLIVMLSDLHIGLKSDSCNGVFNNTVARERLEQYAEQINRYAVMYDANDCYLVLNGDMISGNIHLDLIASNTDNVIEQIKNVSDMLIGFCKTLCTIFNKVYVLSVPGNHSRTAPKDKEIFGERMDNLIPFILSKAVAVNNENFRVLDGSADACNLYGNGIVNFSVRGKEYVAVHGDRDSFNDKGAVRLCDCIHKIPEAVLYGHMHSPAYRVFGNMKQIQCGCLCGSGDDYSIGERYYSKPSQTIIACDSSGVVGIHNVSFD